jgi:8-oxo-dGTP pyrophosphatase MutT (NUDIX family)
VARLTGKDKPDAGRRGRVSRASRATRATSCGGVVLRKNGEQIELCLGMRRRERAGESWTLPKGTPDNGETVEQTAVREVNEETGLEVRIVAPVGDIDYFFTMSGERIHKTVHYFLMEPVGGSLEEHDHEFEDVRFFPVPEALAILTFPTERQLVEQALTVAGL